MTKKLHLVADPTPTPPVADPPRKLGQHGLALWRSVNVEYQIVDAGGVEMLAQACAALDRAEACAEAIARDGELVRVKGGPAKEHPLLRTELNCRAFVVKTLGKLGLDVEPLRSTAGRPPAFA